MFAFENGIAEIDPEGGSVGGDKRAQSLGEEEDALPKDGPNDESDDKADTAAAA